MGRGCVPGPETLPFLGDGKCCRRSQDVTEEGATVGVPGKGMVRILSWIDSLMGVREVVRWKREMGKRALWWQQWNNSA